MQPEIAVKLRSSIFLEMSYLSFRCCHGAGEIIPPLRYVSLEMRTWILSLRGPLSISSAERSWNNHAYDATCPTTKFWSLPRSLAIGRVLLPLGESCSRYLLPLPSSSTPIKSHLEACDLLQDFRDLLRAQREPGFIKRSSLDLFQDQILRANRARRCSRIVEYFRYRQSSTSQEAECRRLAGCLQVQGRFELEGYSGEDLRAIFESRQEDAIEATFS